MDVRIITVVIFINFLMKAGSNTGFLIVPTLKKHINDFLVGMGFF
jgi:hypothetical protein